DESKSKSGARQRCQEQNQGDEHKLGFHAVVPKKLAHYKSGLLNKLSLIYAATDDCSEWAHSTDGAPGDGAIGQACRRHRFFTRFKCLNYSRSRLSAKLQSTCQQPMFHTTGKRICLGYRRLNERGYVIYPGKVSDADCFRIGSIGRLCAVDMRDLLGAIREVLSDMKIELT
ncbi:MAG: hypothetical protein QF376_01885, partial [Anaerolineales bacterium]|nr:hypothetical protein [Anaerolineales bacterium]